MYNSVVFSAIFNHCSADGPFALLLQSRSCHITLRYSCAICAVTASMLYLRIFSRL